MEIEKSKKDFVPSNVFGEDILISDNTNFEFEVKKFLNKLSNLYSKYREKNKELNNEWKYFFEQKYNNVFIEPEQLSIKSPTTIINAPWGTGKTYFIEQIAKYWNNFLNDETQNINTNFKNFIVIDTWKFTTIPNILEAIVNHIYFILCKIVKLEKDEDNKIIFKKIKNVLTNLIFQLPKLLGFVGELIFPNKQLIELGITTSESLKIIKDTWNQNNNDNNNVFNDLKDINEKLEPTIIVFDNVERMGIHSWEIIKAIQQLSIFDNLLFLLPINKTQLSFGGHDNEYERKNESSIDKYITLGTYFNLKQDYLGILNKLDFTDHDAHLINDILNVQINGYNLSIRLVQNFFITNKIKEEFQISKYNGLKKIYEIWSADLIIEIIKEDLMNLKNDYFNLNNILKTKSNLNNDNLRNIINFVNTYKNNEYVLIMEEYFENINKVFEFICLDFYFLKNIHLNILEDWNNYIINLKAFQKQLDQKIIDLNKTIKKNNKEIDRIQKQNKDISEKIEHYSKQKNNIENNFDNTSDEADEKVELEKKLESQETSYQKNNDSINMLKNVNNNINNLLKDINNLIKEEGELEIFIKDFEKIYNDFHQEWMIINCDKNKQQLIGIIKQENLRIKNQEENIINSLTNIFDYENIIKDVISKLLL